MKSKFLGHLGNLSKEDFENILKETKEFRDFEDWKVKSLNVGEMTHTYILKKGNKEYFAKEVKPHEAQINYFFI